MCQILSPKSLNPKEWIVYWFLMFHPNAEDLLLSALLKQKAHKANDDAVMATYDFGLTLSENEIVAELFKIYQELAKQQ